jgi:hypothetical protein
MKPALSEGQLARIADRIRTGLLARRRRVDGVVGRHLEDVLAQHAQLQSIARKLTICSGRGWHAAGVRLTDAAARLLINVPYVANQAQAAIGSCQRPVPSLREIFSELQAAQQEFGVLRYDAGQRVLSVTTDPIGLEGVELGPFEIELDITDLDGHTPYRVVALDPDPAASNEEVTHPHVSAERLCPGDASGAIRMALESGRLGDLFTLVRSVLTTYNPESPYVPLANWHGHPCYDCGHVMDDDSRFFCESCERDYCDECTSYCRQCEESFCQECLTTCAHCDEPCCKACVPSCSDCDEACCKACLEDGLCPPCLEDLEENDESEEDQRSDQGQVEGAGQAAQTQTVTTDSASTVRLAV